MNNQPKDGYQYAAILGVLITTTSRGNVSLVSADTSDLPAINPNWLSTRADQELAIAMFKRIRQAFASEPMRPIVIGDEYDPGNAVTSDSQILNWIRNNIMTLWHPACTCKMGASRDPFAVVNSRAHVYGVNRLRVVDASAFPFLPPGHPQSTVCRFYLYHFYTTAYSNGVGSRYVSRKDRRPDYSWSLSVDLSTNPTIGI